MKTVDSAKTFPPGKLLDEELERRGWSQADFAKIIERPPRLVNEIIKAKRAVTPETALALGEVFKTGAEFWLRMESLYQLSKAHVRLEPIAKRARLYELFPIREMQKRGWIPTTRDPKKLENSLLEFFEIPSVDSKLSAPHAAKRTIYEEVSALQAAWLRRARHLSAHQSVPKFKPREIPGLYDRLRALTSKPEDVWQVPGLLLDAGIAFVVLEALPGSKIDGACWWLSPSRPAIALSLRYDRHDMFWHALFHEIDHIDHKEGLDDPVLDWDLFLSKQRPPEEVRANANAAKRLVPQEELEAFVARARNSYSQVDIVAFAERMKVHPGIVVGQLQHRDHIPWSSYNFLKSRVREQLTPHALTDGFGMVVK